MVGYIDAAPQTFGYTDAKLQSFDIAHDRFVQCNKDLDLRTYTWNASLKLHFKLVRRSLHCWNMTSRAVAFTSLTQDPIKCPLTFAALILGPHVISSYV